MSTFNIVVSHNNGERCKIQVQAENSVAAGRLCDEIKLRNKEMLDRWEGMNVFVSKQVKECVLCPREWKEELGCISENNV